MAIEPYIADLEQTQQKFQAVREFTDREEYRASFWRKFGDIQEDMTQPLEKRRNHVLTFYGYGGIGKTTLAKKLCSEMEEHNPTPIYALYDFKTSQDHIQALSKLHAALSEKGKFSFPLFEYGLHFYAKKTGGNANSTEVQSVLDNSPALKLFFKVAKCIPIASEIASITEGIITTASNIVGMAEDVLSMADEGVTAIRNHVLRSSRDGIVLDKMDADDLYQYLPQLFILDMQKNLRKSKRPVVILLDTYEALVNEIAHSKSYMEYDKWLRSTEKGKKGVIVGTPGVLWVITGREKLKWPEDWDDTILEQHNLGQLSEHDSKQFLRKCGILDEALLDGLWKLTEGFPLHLDLCVKCYEGILEKNLTPEISLFGKDKSELVARFMRYTSTDQQDHINILACLHHWSEDLIADLDLPKFSDSTHETVMGLSIVDATDPRYCYIHQVVEAILTEACPPFTRKRVGDALLKRFLPALNKWTISDREYAEALFYAMRGAILRYKNRDQLCSFYTENLKAPLFDFFKAVFYVRGHLAKPAVELLYAVAKDDSTDSLYTEWLDLLFHLAVNDDNPIESLELALTQVHDTKGKHFVDMTTKVLTLKARNFRMLDRYDEELSTREMLLDFCRSSLGKYHSETLNVAYELARALRYHGQAQKAFDLIKSTYEDCRIDHGDNHLYTIAAMKKFADWNSLADQHQEAVILYRNALEKSSAILGHDHPMTNDVMKCLAVQLFSMGLQQERLDLFRDVYKKRCVTLGHDHPMTIDVMKRLAEQLIDMKQHQEALDIRKTILEIQRTRHGEVHKDTIGAMREYIRSICALGQHQDVPELLNDFLGKYRTTPGHDHPDILKGMDRLASDLSRLGLFQEALVIRKTIWDVQITIHGDVHLDTLDAANEYIKVLNKLGEHGHALLLQNSILEQFRTTLGHDHPDTLEAMIRIAALLRVLDEKLMSIDLLKDALEKYHTKYGDEHQRIEFIRLCLSFME